MMMMIMFVMIMMVMIMITMIQSKRRVWEEPPGALFCFVHNTHYDDDDDDNGGFV